MRLHEIAEGLDSNQRRVGQVGAEEKANKVSPVLGHKDKQHPFKGRLVGESAEELNIGDPVIITGNVNFKGKTGDIDGFGKDKKFVIVNLYNYGRHSFHTSDVSYNDYADEDLDEASLATMRDYFAGNKDAQDEMEITKQRKYYQELRKKEEEERQKKAALQKGITKIGGNIKEFAPAGGEGGDNYGGNLHDILMAYISANEPGLLKHFGRDVVDGVVSNMIVMRTFDDIDPNNEDDLDNALDQIIEILNDEQGVAEGRFDEPLTGWHIVYRKSGNPVHATPSFETKDQAQKYLMTKMFANHQDYKVVHTAGVGVAEGNDEKIADRYDQDEWDEKMRRLKKLAGAGPLKTVWDPEKRVYKNVPVNQKPENR